jgi:hypothetical protein
VTSSVNTWQSSARLASPRVCEPPSTFCPCTPVAPGFQLPGRRSVGEQGCTTTTTMAFGGGNNKLLDQIFNLKFTSKQLVRASKKCETEEKEEKNKVRRPEALEVGTRASS